ncbi:expansin EXLX1 family cellulose-binding protein [Ideonella sp.]|uniref:expansin EXLX1 family cellulose-binding protein n=1 Tax=Ideonella sp. TaxID=1929293 RepID=UPI0035B144E9
MTLLALMRAARLGLAPAALAAGLLATTPPALAQGGYDRVHSGDATFYSYSGGGNCSLPVPAMPTAALNAADYNGAQACGACLRVTNPANGKAVDVRVDDSCPECAVGDVDLDDDAFAAIAEPWLGRIPVTWQYIACPAPRLSIFFRPESNPWWTQVQVRDHRYPVKTFAWRPAGTQAAFTRLPRESYNYFTAASGLGSGAVDLKLTDVYGQVVRVNGVVPEPGSTVPTKKQFPLR